MKKTLTFFSFIFLLGIFLVPSSVSAAQEAQITLNSFVQEYYLYSKTTDNLVLDFSLTVTEADTLNDLVVQNNGDAKNSTDIADIILWLDDGNDVYDGFGVDTELATGSSNSVKSWSFVDLDVALEADSTSRFYVTVSLTQNGTEGSSFMFALSGYNDMNSNTVFDANEFGVFLESGYEIPDQSLEMTTFAKYNRRGFDPIAPKVVIDNLSDGETVIGDSYVINGRSRESGGSGIDDIEICINTDCLSASNEDVDFESWQYSWQNISEGDYEIYAKATDNNGNTRETEKIVVTFQLEEDEVIDLPDEEPELSFWEDGRFLKISDSPAVYFLDANDVRHVYPTYSVWQSYFGADFSSVETVEGTVLSSYDLAANVPMKEGSLMEVESLTKYYKVGAEGTLQWVKSEATLVELFGADWIDQVYYLQAGFYSYYTVLDPIE
jgi:hypothetical protein